MRKTTWRALQSAGVIVTAFAVGATSVSAEECGTDGQGTFFPGMWIGSGADTQRDVDAIGELLVDREGQFNLTVDSAGVVVAGALVYEVEGVNLAQSMEGGSRASWRIEAALSGIGSSVDAIGQLDMSMDSAIDISGTDGEDIFHGSPTMTNGSAFSRDVQFVLAPEEMDCTMAVGTFSFDDATTISSGGGDGVFEPLVWVAVRSNIPRAPEVVDRLVDVVTRAQEFMMDETFVVDELTAIVHDLVAINGFLAGADCELPRSLRPGSPTARFAAYTLLRLFSDFLDTAMAGYYSTADVVRVFSLGLESASMQPGACTGESGDARTEAIRKFHAVLDDRLERARAQGDDAEVALVHAAAFQYGFFDLVEG